MDKWLLLSLIIVLIILGNIGIYSIRNKRMDKLSLTKDASSVERLSRMLKSMKQADKVDFWIENAESFTELSEQMDDLEQMARDHESLRRMEINKDNI